MHVLRQMPRAQRCVHVYAPLSHKEVPLICVSVDLLPLQVTQQPAQPKHGMGRWLKKGQLTYCGRVAPAACQVGLDQYPGQVMEWVTTREMTVGWVDECQTQDKDVEWVEGWWGEEMDMGWVKGWWG